MSDIRQQISERHLPDYGDISQANERQACRRAMSDYAVALLEPPLSVEERQRLYTLMQQWARDTDWQFEEVAKWINEMLRARAAQERER